MEKIRNCNKLESVAISVLKGLFPNELKDVIKVTDKKSKYRQEYGIDFIIDLSKYIRDVETPKDPLLCNGTMDFSCCEDDCDWHETKRLLLGEIKMNATHSGQISFTKYDKLGNKFDNKPMPDVYIFIMRYKDENIAWLVSSDSVKELVESKFYLNSKYNKSVYVWVTRKDLEEHASIVIRDKHIMRPGGVLDTSGKKGIEELYYSAARNINPMKDTQDLWTFFNSCQSLNDL